MISHSKQPTCGHIGFLVYGLLLWFYWLSVMVLSKWLPGGHIGLLVFQNLTFVLKYLLQTSLAYYLCVWEEAYWSSVMSFSKWPISELYGMVSEFKFELDPQIQISCACCLWRWAEAYWLSAMSRSEWPHDCHIRFLGLRTLTLVYLLQTSVAHDLCVWLESIGFHGYHFQNGRLGAMLEFLVFGLNDMVFGRISRLVNRNFHADVIKWKHSPCYCAFVQGIHQSPVNPLTKTIDAELWCFLWFASEPTVE